MNDAKKMCSVLVLCLFVVGCGPHIPTSEYPMEVEKVIHAPFESVWDNSLQVIETLEATIIAKDKSSGLISCKFPHDKSKSQTYTNIYIRSNPQNRSVVNIYLIPYDFSSYAAIRYVKYPEEKGVILRFRNMSFRKNYFSDVYDMFFDKLKGKL